MSYPDVNIKYMFDKLGIDPTPEVLTAIEGLSRRASEVTAAGLR